MVAGKLGQDGKPAMQETMKPKAKNAPGVSTLYSFSLISSASFAAGSEHIRSPPIKNLMLDREYLNKIFNHDCRDMKDLPDNSVDLMITSPPYNATKRYDDNLSLKEYLGFIEEVLKEVFRVLKTGGIVAFNIANVGRKPYLPLDCFTIQIFHKIGYDIIQEYCWNKAASSGGSCAWGSWMSASNPSLRDVHEYIIIAGKKTNDVDMCFPVDDLNEIPKKIDNRSFTLNPTDFYTNIWSFNTESAKRVNHPAPFPVELPYRIIRMYSKKGALVLDPFMGSGSVAIAALIAGRNYVGYDLDPEYIKIANERIEAYKMNSSKGGRK